MTDVVRAIAVWHDGVEHREGDALPAGIPAAKVKDWKDRGLVVDDGDEVVADAPPVTELPDPLSVTMSELASALDAAKATAPQVVALAQDDPERAQLLIDAEHLLGGGDGRKTVIEPLQKIVDQGDGA